MMPSKVKVLLIEDDEEDYLIIRDLLKDIQTVQYELEWESDPEKALEEIRKQDSDVYLIDHRLGKTTGLEIISRLRDEKLLKPMILLTGQSDYSLDVAAMESGAWDFLSKGRVTSELLERSIRYSMKRSEDAAKILSAEKLETEKKIAEAANKTKSDFLANMSHEMRTPLTAILGYSHLAKDRATSEKERLQFLDVIERNGEHLLELINDLLDLSKIEAGQLDVHSGNCDWHRQIEEVIQNLQPKADQKSIKLSLKYDPEIPTKFKTDCQRFRQIMLNLVGNAVKFTEKGEVSVLVELESEVLRPALKFSICDSGVGISDEEKKKLFQTFSQVNSTRTRKFGGTGLGLNISKRLAKALGGDLILADSKPNVGSVFVLTHPFERVVEGQTSAYQKRPKHIYSGVGLRVLLVDDSFDNRELIRRFLKSANFEVETATNGKESIGIALKGNFDVVLMDIEMPEMDGYEVTSTLRSLGYRKPIVALSAHASNHKAEMALQIGFTGYITKPCSKEELIKSLIEIIETHENSERVG